MFVEGGLHFNAFTCLQITQEMLSYVMDLCQSEASLQDPQLFRFIAHLIMTLQQLVPDIMDDQNVKDKVENTFKGFLKITKKKEHCAFTNRSSTVSSPSYTVSVAWLRSLGIPLSCISTHRCRTRSMLPALLASWPNFSESTFRLRPTPTF